MAMSFKLHLLSVQKTWPPTLLYKVTTHSAHMPAIVRPPDPYILTRQMTLSLPHSLFLSLHTTPSISFNSILESWLIPFLSHFFLLFVSVSFTLSSHSFIRSLSLLACIALYKQTDTQVCQLPGCLGFWSSARGAKEKQKQLPSNTVTLSGCGGIVTLFLL